MFYGVIFPKRYSFYMFLWGYNNKEEIMRKPNETTTAVYFTIGKNKKLKACQMTLKGRHSEEEIEKFLENKYSSSNNKFYLLFDVVA